MQRMAGPYVTQLYSIFQDTQCVCLVMELCEGGDLFKTLMRHGGRLPEHVVCVEVWLQSVSSLLDTVDSAHNQLPI
jgi:serine/threonine protein kinase